MSVIVITIGCTGQQLKKLNNTVFTAPGDTWGVMEFFHIVQLGPIILSVKNKDLGKKRLKELNN